MSAKALYLDGFSELGLTLILTLTGFQNGAFSCILMHFIDYIKIAVSLTTTRFCAILQGLVKTGVESSNLSFSATSCFLEALLYAGFGDFIFFKEQF